MYARLVNCWAAGDPRLRVVDVEHRQRDRVVVAPEVDCHTCHMTIEQRHIYIYICGERFECVVCYIQCENTPLTVSYLYIHTHHTCMWVVDHSRTTGGMRGHWRRSGTLGVSSPPTAGGSHGTDPYQRSWNRELAIPGRRSPVRCRSYACVRPTVIVWSVHTGSLAKHNRPTV